MDKARTAIQNAPIKMPNTGCFNHKVSLNESLYTHDDMAPGYASTFAATCNLSLNSQPQMGPSVNRLSMQSTLTPGSGRATPMGGVFIAQKPLVSVRNGFGVFELKPIPRIDLRVVLLANAVR